MNIKINDLPPMPRNRSHMLIVKGGRPMNIKTPLCREFEADLTSRLQEFNAIKGLFLSPLDLKKHYLVAKYIIYTPKEVLITKQGHISSKSVDCDAHKVMQDVIFSYLGIDDKLIREVTYITPVSQDDKWNYSISLAIREIKDLYV